MSMFPIASYTETAGTNYTASFTSIPQTFTHLQVRAVLRSTRTTNTFEFPILRFNNDATSGNYYNHQLYGDGGSAQSSSSSNSFIYPGVTTADNAMTSGVFGVVICDILDYTNTNKNKVVRGLSGVDSNLNNTSGLTGLASGLWLSTAAVNRIDFGTGNNPMVIGSRIDLYGIQTA